MCVLRSSRLGDLHQTTVERAALAMIGHVLSDRQQFGGDDEAVARAVARHLFPTSR
jgi:hypothetical protein